MMNSMGGDKLGALINISSLVINKLYLKKNSSKDMDSLVTNVISKG